MYLPTAYRTPTFSQKNLTMRLFATLAIILPLVALSLCATIEKRQSNVCRPHMYNASEKWGEEVELTLDQSHDPKLFRSWIRNNTKQLNHYWFYLQMESVEGRTKTFQIMPAKSQHATWVPDYQFIFNVYLKNGKKSRAYWLTANQICTNDDTDWENKDIDKVTYQLRLWK